MRNYIREAATKLEPMILEKFLRYVAIDTQSSETSDTYPSTMKQLDLSRLLVSELKSMGITNADLDQHGYVTASIKSNIPKENPAYNKVPVVGFLAHVDTSHEVSGANVKPLVIKNYRGGDISLPKDSTVIKADSIGLEENIGNDIVTSDGSTLLGADDKAGVAIIMSMAQILMENPDLMHGEIKIAFTPDEEVGTGTKFFDVKKFGAKYAYTIDGNCQPEINKETFSANAAVVKVLGKESHPGAAKNVMINAARVAAEIVARLPRDMAPETTENHEPYLHPYAIEGGVAKASVKILLRDFRTEGLNELEKIIKNAIAEANLLYPKAEIELSITETYRNMLDDLQKHPSAINCLEEAVKRTGLTPNWKPIRGGTDGSKLTAMGLPTPNIFTGCGNIHSKAEWVSVWGMRKSLETILNILQIYLEKEMETK